ncbi:conserved hypothetical protein [Gluconacetobacter diazotrophicus PA1 5]|uniref:Uncharacterized protein n=2 Tax=Gluconacetobacter diazotrophicus TaxID=33996 RepID=A0A7W4FEF6_GLUDI|nr:hypothetical protein [Gluconacetobacter diazotrophicus]ACI50040.1 conserved hypothetical protein [Gluconacetobacter diazotrophicus PA1 5]MBB2156266.1 hypothetical protein [Gluconacetobacter diazotrophicus]TWB07880.1 hypothetical protein FBZ86_10970 [Gluconacetobacter diazotrophicus]CAP55962.1 putative membrane protein [Gluconacetobacter diazotrophicus PA1 5]
MNAENGQDAPIGYYNAPHGVAAAERALALGAFAIGTGEFAIMGMLPDMARNRSAGPGRSCRPAA